MIKRNILLATSLLAPSLAAAAITIDTVPVGDAGHPGQVQSQGTFGKVSYNYHIGIYEVTNSQYTAFLNSVARTDTFGLYNTNMSGSFGGILRSGTDGSYTYTATNPNGPVNYVSFWDAARFTNWLTTGNTEAGVYMLNGVATPINSPLSRNATAWNAGGVAIASEDEWYKAAYYGGSPTGADGDGYWLYPTQSNGITTADANYGNMVGDVTVVGTYAADPSHYGTFDQGGNVWEWNDAVVGSERRGMRGGSFFDAPAYLRSYERGGGIVTFEDSDIGFRVSSLTPIPEPSAFAAILGCLGLSFAQLWGGLHRKRGFFATRNAEKRGFPGCL